MNESAGRWMDIWQDISRKLVEDACSGAAAARIDSPDFVINCIRGGLSSWLSGKARAPIVSLEHFRDYRDDDSAASMQEETCRSTIAPSAKAAMRSEIKRAGGREVSFVLVPIGGGQFGDPRVMVRGREAMTLYLPADIPAGPSLLVHNHPSGNLSPTEPDLDALLSALRCNPLAGFGIVDDNVDRLYLCRDPGPSDVAVPIPPVDPGASRED
jgi:hypothetical protein